MQPSNKYPQEVYLHENRLLLSEKDKAPHT